MLADLTARHTHDQNDPSDNPNKPITAFALWPRKPFEPLGRRHNPTQPDSGKKKGSEGALHFNLV